MILLLLWCGWLWSAASAAAGPSAPGRVRCDEAHKRCLYREDCAETLFGYMRDCSDVLHGLSTKCPRACRRTLISLMSHGAGALLATCDCAGDRFCETSRERLEVCRPEVSHATADDTVVSCSTAELICSADAQCSTALAYYHRLCRSMFHGHRCTRRCNNSLDILGRQERAAKLRGCFCDGSEDFPCVRIKENTQRLCLGREEYVEETHQRMTPASTPQTTGASGGCTRTLRPSLTCLLSCVLVVILGALRTSGAGNFRLPAKDCRSERGRHPMTARSGLLHFTVWPWWWTSEEKSELGNECVLVTR